VVPLSYLGLSVQLFLFPWLLRSRPWARPVFFAWVSVFNLFGTALFWGLLSDLFPRDSARKEFGRIAAAGSLGGLAGAALCAYLARRQGPLGTIPIAGLCLVGASAFAGRLAVDRPTEAKGLGGSALEGIAGALRSPRLLALGALLSLQTLLSTFLYLEGARLALERGVGVAPATAVFASVDVAAGLLALPIQLFAARGLMERAGVGVALAALPATAFLGFVALALWPEAGVVVGLTVLTRALHLALLRPAREVLFTTLGPQARYKSKTFVDTALQRLGDASSSWLLVALASRGFGLPGLALVGGSVALIATWVGYTLGGGLETRSKPGQDFEASGSQTPDRPRCREPSESQRRQI
jgi:AAA family ATP:ADP antiporter